MDCTCYYSYSVAFLIPYFPFNFFFYTKAFWTAFSDSCCLTLTVFFLSFQYFPLAVPMRSCVYLYWKERKPLPCSFFCSWSGNCDRFPPLWSHTHTLNQTLTCFSLLPLKQSLYQRRHLSHSVFNETFPWNTHQWNTPFLLHSSEIRWVFPLFYLFLVLPLLKVVRQRVRGRTPALQWYTTLNVTINGYNIQTVSETALLE